MSSDKAPFSWEDPFQMQSQFSEEERMIQESARDYAQNKLLSRVRDAFRHETFDREIMNEFGAMGMLATAPSVIGAVTEEIDGKGSISIGVARDSAFLF